MSREGQFRVKSFLLLVACYLLLAVAVSKA